MSIVKYVNTQNLRKDRTPRDSNLAGGVFNYDRYKGSQGTGPGNTIFGTTRKFTPDDGSLQVFKNGTYQFQDIGNGNGGDYAVIDSQSIKFYNTINANDDIVLLVNGGTIVRDASQNNFNNITELFGDVYHDGTGVMFNTGNKAFAANYNLESLTFWVSAVVGTRGTHSDLQTAINSVAAGSLIIVKAGTHILPTTVLVNKDDITIMGVGRGAVIQGDGTFQGLNLQNVGIKIINCKLNNFTTAVKVSAEKCMVTGNYFANNTTDVDYSGISQVEIENNISE